MNFNLNDTISAISTPPGEGGIAVIRISGADAFKITERIFYKDKAGRHSVKLNEFESHTVHFGFISGGESIIDESLVTIFKNPNSYTGEDVIEISSHGGNFIARKILKLILSKGARLAEPGEFTRRAFLNGKMDLAQAEAVADLISSQTESAHASSIRQLEGSLSELVHGIKEEIINVTSLIELELDFAEEDLEFVKKDEVRNKIEKIITRLESVIASYIQGKVIREGVRLVIAGRPNSGKSSLFNYLLKTNRAIVSDVAGTTRDFIEERLIIGGIVFNLTDTAGLRSSDDHIESEGIKRSFSKIDEADLIIYLIDSSAGENETEEELNSIEKNFDQKKTIPVFSKSDLGKISEGITSEGKTLPGKASEVIAADGKDILNISLLKDDSIETLKTAMLKKLSLENITSDKSGEIIITNLRHRICLENTVTSLRNAAATLDEGMTGEFLSVDLRNSLSHLGEITGEVTNDDILNNIFRNFCIGK
ncbi:MAG: tRNA uridine-5-carboxymethylaminomethyl(34) synthesis GTPase MnmE, partial [Ignavibacteria bacterium]|nr:tRNA uridine-5-carboxymethylaminomethyl(34) synthesis GTPase MnmE [Ignavibacteria bacterium]